MGWLIVAAFSLFLLWQLRRASDKTAEMSASGELRSPLYWTGAVLAISVLALSLVMASIKPPGIGPLWWTVAIALFVATLLIRHALCRRYPH